MDCAWPRPLLLLLALVCVIAYIACLQHEVPNLLQSLAGMKSRRYEPSMAAAFFALMVIAPPLAIVPSGSIMVAGAILGYVYGLQGLALAWPGFTIGLFITFSAGRFLRSRGRQMDAAESASDVPIPFVDQKKAKALMRGARRLLRDHPKRMAVLLTFATHSPLTQFLLGWGTDLAFVDSVVACATDGVKMIVPLLKGMAIGDILEIATMKAASNGCWSGGMYCPALALKIVICAAFAATFFFVGRSVLQELRDMEEAGEGDALQCSSSSSGAATHLLSTGSATFGCQATSEKKAEQLP